MSPLDLPSLELPLRDTARLGLDRDLAPLHDEAVPQPEPRFSRAALVAEFRDQPGIAED